MIELFLNHQGNNDFYLDSPFENTKVITKPLVPLSWSLLLLKGKVRSFSTWFVEDNSDIKFRKRKKIKKTVLTNLTNLFNLTVQLINRMETFQKKSIVFQSIIFENGNKRVFNCVSYLNL